MNETPRFHLSDMQSVHARLNDLADAMKPLEDGPVADAFIALLDALKTVAHNSPDFIPDD